MYGIIETSTLIISTTPTESYGYGLIRIGELVADSVFFDGGALFYQDAPVITRSATDTLLFFNMTGHVHSLRILKMFFDVECYTRFPGRPLYSSFNVEGVTFTRFDTDAITALTRAYSRRGGIAGTVNEQQEGFHLSRCVKIDLNPIRYRDLQSSNTAGYYPPRIDRDYNVITKVNYEGYSSDSIYNDAYANADTGLYASSHLNSSSEPFFSSESSLSSESSPSIESSLSSESFFSSMLDFSSELSS